MSHYRKLILGVAGPALLAAGGIAAAIESHGGENDALAISSAKITLLQAVGTAQNHIGGAASRAEFESGKRGVYFDVEVVRGTKVFDVRIDAASGAVLSAQEDKEDASDEKHERH